MDKKQDEAPSYLKYAESIYRKKMEISTVSPNFIEFQDLLNYHELAIQHALEIIADTESLTLSKKQEIQRSLENLFSKYREINLKKRDSPSPAIGIDLGTTNCCVAVYQGGQMRIIPNDMGFDKTPSFVAFPVDEDKPIFGETAKMLAYQNPQNTIYNVKRMLGRKFDQIQIQHQMSLWPFDIVNDNGNIKIKIYEKNKNSSYNLNPEDISSLLIRYLKESAEDALGMPVLNAVVAVPANFNAHQREITKKACENAGLNVLQLVNEPTAAAVAYNMHKNNKGQFNSIKATELRNCLIFDLGGGTLDVAVLTIKNNQLFIKTIGGDANLGGEDFDNNMVNYCIEEFKKKHNIDLAAGKSSTDTLEKFKSSKSLRRLKMECEKQKRCLCKLRKVIVSVEAIHETLDLTVEFTQTTLEKLNLHLYQKCIDIVQDVLSKSEVNKEDVHSIVLAGGSTRIPKIQQMLSEFFAGAKLSKEINPDDAIAVGAAMLAYYAENPEVPNVLIREPDYSNEDIEDPNRGDFNTRSLLPTELRRLEKTDSEYDSNSSHFSSRTSGMEVTSTSPTQANETPEQNSLLPSISNEFEPLPPATWINRDSVNNRSSPDEFDDLNDNENPAAETELRVAKKEQETTPEVEINNNVVEPTTSKDAGIQKSTRKPVSNYTTAESMSVTLLLRQDKEQDESQGTNLAVDAQMHGCLSKKNYQIKSKPIRLAKFEPFYGALHEKTLYLFQSEEDFWANDTENSQKIDVHKASCELKDYLGTNKSFRLKVMDGSEYLFLADNAISGESWVTHIDKNSVKKMDPTFKTYRPSKVAEFIKEIQKNL